MSAASGAAGGAGGGGGGGGYKSSSSSAASTGQVSFGAVNIGASSGLFSSIPQVAWLAIAVVGGIILLKFLK